MKVLLINTYDSGGAANSCLRLHIGLLEQELESKLLLKYKSNFSISNSYVFEQPIPTPSFYKKLSEKFGRIAVELKLAKPNSRIHELQNQFTSQRSKGLEMFSFLNANTDITLSSLYQEADIINLHWVADFLDWESFFSRNTKPIVWTLHDQNPFLGGEHYAERFLGINQQGFPIKREYTNTELKEQDKILNLKKNVLKNVDNLFVVSPSKWLLESSKNSELFAKYPHYHIPYGYPKHIFKPYDKKFCREVLGLPQDKTILLFVADSVDNHRKGFVYLKNAIEKLSSKYQKEVLLCAIGKKNNLSASNNLIELGKIVDERLMAIIYNSADAFIIPSLEDNLPNTMIESVLCGTPTIGFPTGGITDAIQDGENGYLCPEISVNALKETIEKFLDNPHFFDTEKIASDAKAKYALDVQAKAYINLYQKILPPK